MLIKITSVPKSLEQLDERGNPSWEGAGVMLRESLHEGVGSTLRVVELYMECEEPASQTDGWSLCG